MKAKEFERSKIFNLAQSIDYAKESVVSKTVTNRPEGTITLFAFDKGQGLSEHTTPFDAHVEVLDGEVRVLIGGKEYELSTGEMIIMPANIPHALEAIKAFKMLLTMVKSRA